MPLIVVVDANILRASPNLELNPWKSLLDRQEEWDLELIVPEVALHEAVHLLRAGWEKELEKVQALNIGNLLDLDAQQQELADMLTARIDQLEEWFLDRCEELGIGVASPPDDIDWMDIAKRAIYRQPPYNEYSEKPKDGFRDTLIWHTLLAIAAEDSDAEVWFVSKNHKDFGEPGLEARELNSWSVPFHPALASELAARGLAERVHYVTNMPRLVSNLSARFEPIGEDEFQDLLAQLNQDSLIDALMNRVINLPLDPRTAALDLNVKGGRVATATKPQWEAWHFEERARAGRPGGWRARFEIDTQVDIDTTELAGEGTVHDKWLRFSGDLTVLPDGSVTQLVVTTAEALPEDPMRARWKRVDAETRAVGVAAQDWMLGALRGPAWNEALSNLAAISPALQVNAEIVGLTQGLQNTFAKLDTSGIIGAAYSGRGIDTTFANLGTTMISRGPAIQISPVHQAAIERVAKLNREKPSMPRRPAPAKNQPEPSSESPQKPKKTPGNKATTKKTGAKKATAKPATTKKATAEGTTKKAANKKPGSKKAAGGKGSTAKRTKP